MLCSSVTGVVAMAANLNFDRRIFFKEFGGTIEFRKRLRTQYRLINIEEDIVEPDRSVRFNSRNFNLFNAYRFMSYCSISLELSQIEVLAFRDVALHVGMNTIDLTTRKPDLELACFRVRLCDTHFLSIRQTFVDDLSADRLAGLRVNKFALHDNIRIGAVVERKLRAIDVCVLFFSA